VIFLDELGVKQAIIEVVCKMRRYDAYEKVELRDTFRCQGKFEEETTALPAFELHDAETLRDAYRRV